MYNIYLLFAVSCWFSSIVLRIALVRMPLFIQHWWWQWRWDTISTVSCLHYYMFFLLFFFFSARMKIGHSIVANDFSGVGHAEYFLLYSFHHIYVSLCIVYLLCVSACALTFCLLSRKYYYLFVLFVPFFVMLNNTEFDKRMNPEPIVSWSSERTECTQW